MIKLLSIIKKTWKNIIAGLFMLIVIFSIIEIKTEFKSIRPTSNYKEWNLLQNIDSRLNFLEDQISSIKSNVSNVELSTSSIEYELSAIKSDVSMLFSIETQVNSIQYDVSSIKRSLRD